MLVIREAQKQDFDCCFRLLKQLWPDKKIKKIRAFRDFLNKQVFIAKKDKKVVGLSVLSTHLYSLVARVNAFVIDKKFRRHGIGKRLLKKTIQTAKNHSCKLVFLTSSLKRQKAHKFYQSNNFKKVGTVFYLKI